MTDPEIVRRILSGDRRTVYWFYHAFEPKLRRFLHAKISNRSDAEEVFQDTLFAFLDALRDYTGRATIKTFLFKICTHKVVDYYRRKKIKLLVFSQIPQLEALVSPFLTPEETFDAIQVREKIKHALSRILPHYRELLIDKYMDDLSLAAIAQKCMVSVKSVEGRLSRARKAFVEAFVAT